ncbi:MAG: 6-carboxytetrahydropterin synthase [Nevskia sp.]
MSQLFVEQLTVIDCSYLDAERGVVGESWIVDIELEGELDAQSMVLDFGEVKKRLKRALDDSADHTLLVPLRHAGLSLHRTAARVELEFRGPAAGPVEHGSPAQAVSLVDAERITAGTLTEHLRPILAAQLPANVAAVHLRLRTEAIAGAYYHYTHGLKKHAGHCQRIAHGHRSRIEIRVDGERDAALESHRAERWRDIYLGTREDLVREAGGRLRFEYAAAEGAFSIELPASRCDLMQDDSTVECIAAHLARDGAAARPGAVVEVRAYEGVMKGARARATHRPPGG